MSIVGAGIGPTGASQVFMSDHLTVAPFLKLIPRSVFPKLSQILDEELILERLIFQHDENENTLVEFYRHCSDDWINFRK